MDPKVPYKGTFVTTLGGDRIVVWYKIAELAVHATFRAHNKQYEFDMSRWKGKGFAYFAALFLSQYDNEPELFGTVNDLGIPETDAHQRNNIIRYAMVDVFHCADRIVSQNLRMVLDYAVFHRESQKEIPKYRDYIHRVACNVLVHANYTGSVDYPRIELNDLFDHYDATQFDKTAMTEADDE